MVSARVFLLAAAAIPAHAFWRMECRGVAGYFRLDPLVSPGEASMHSHAIVGSGGFSDTATYADLTGSDCTSCLVTQDKSSYWHPSLYFRDATTGLFELVSQAGGMLSYYMLNTGNGNTNITAFPAGFHMIAGDNNRRSFTAGNVQMVDPDKSDWAALNQTTQDKLAQRAIGFNCLDYSGTPEPSLLRHFLPEKAYLDANCKSGLRIELMFPSCWNGADLDSANHRDHVAYPDLVMQGDCPEGFPVRVPSLFYETIWNTQNYAGRTGDFVLSNGDMQGFAYHGDFMTGWDADFLQAAIERCTNLSGEIKDCPLFDIQSEADANTCKITPPSVVAGEDDTQPAPTLPGNLSPFGDRMDGSLISPYNPAFSSQPTFTSVNGGYGAGSPVAAATPTTSTASIVVPAVPSNPAAPAAQPTVISVPAAVAVPAPAAVTDGLANVAAASSPAPTTTTVTSTAPVAAAAVPPNDPNAVSTQYITNGNMVTEIVWAQTTVYVTEDVDAAPSPAVRRRHAHHHVHRNAHV